MQRGSGDDGCTPTRFHGKMFDDTYIFVYPYHILSVSGSCEKVWTAVFAPHPNHPLRKPSVVEQEGSA